MLSSAATVTITIAQLDGKIVFTTPPIKYNAGSQKYVWSPIDKLTDGTYTANISADDGIKKDSFTTVVIIDTKPPVISFSRIVISDLSVFPSPFSPDGDGQSDTTTVTFKVSNTNPVPPPAGITSNLVGEFKFSDFVFSDFVGKFKFDSNAAGAEAKFSEGPFNIPPGSFLKITGFSTTKTTLTIKGTLNSTDIQQTIELPEKSDSTVTTTLKFDQLKSISASGQTTTDSFSMFWVASEATFIKGPFNIPPGSALKLTGFFKTKTTITIKGTLKSVDVQETTAELPANSAFTVTTTQKFDQLKSISATGQSITDSFRLFWLTGSVAATVNRLDGTFVKNLTLSPPYGGDGTYAATWDGSFQADGQYIIQITATDETGKTSRSAMGVILSKIRISIDKFTSSPSIISPLNQDAISDIAIILYQISKRGIVTIDIVGEDGLPITTLIKNEVTEANLSRQITWDGKDIKDFVASGKYIVNIAALDPDTLQIDTATLTINVDNILPPKPKILFPSANTITSEATITIRGLVNEAGADITIQVMVNDKVVITSKTIGTFTGEFNLANVPLAEGKNLVAVKVIDPAGNIGSASDPITLTLDTFHILILNPALNPAVISPNGDSVADQTIISYRLSKKGKVTVKILDKTLKSVKSFFAQPQDHEANIVKTLIWDGKGDTGEIVKDDRYTVSIEAFDEILKETITASLSITMDTTSPKKPILVFPLADTPPTSIATTTIRGIVEGESGAGYTIQMFINDKVATTSKTTDTYTGEFNLENVPLTEGKNQIVAKVIDPVGNISPASDPITLTVDTVHISIVNPALIPAVISPNSDFIADKTIISYQISKKGEVSINIKDSKSLKIIKKLMENEIQDANIVKQIIWDGKGEVGKEVEAFVDSGVYIVEITVFDDILKETTTRSLNLTVDKILPKKPELVSPLNNSSINKTMILVKGLVVDEPGAGLTIDVFVNRKIAASLTTDSKFTGEFSFEKVELVAGKNEISVQATDAVGNKSSLSDTRSVLVDLQAPSTSDDSISDWYKSSTVEINLTAIDLPTEAASGVKATYFTTDGSNPTRASTSGNKVTLTEDGIFSLKYFSDDEAGNVESPIKQAKNLIKIDTKPPSSVIDRPKNGDLFRPDIEKKIIPPIFIRGAASDVVPPHLIEKKRENEVSGLRKVEIGIGIATKEDPNKEDPSSITWLQVDGTTSWSFSFTPEALGSKFTPKVGGQTRYFIRTRAKDIAGNEEKPTAPISIIIDTSELPKLLATPIAAGKIKVTWQPIGDFKAYDVYRQTFRRQTQKAPDFIKDFKIPQTEKPIASNLPDITYIDANTIDGAEYFYIVTASGEREPKPLFEEASAIADKSPPKIENITVIPNPFTPDGDRFEDQTTIFFTLSEETTVTLNIYSESDPKNPIANLIDGKSLRLGDQRVIWDGRMTNGQIAKPGRYIFKFEQIHTFDRATNVLLQDITGVIALQESLLSISNLSIQPNPFSPNGDNINDITNIDFTLSGFADFVAANIFDTSGGTQRLIKSTSVQALDFVFTGEEWTPIHIKDGIPPGRGSEHYFIKPVDAKKAPAPPFHVPNFPKDALTVEDYLKNYQANNPLWIPVTLSITWNGSGAEKPGAFIFRISATTSSGQKAIEKTGEIIMETISVFPNDKTAPFVIQTNPEENADVRVQISEVTAVLNDGAGTGIDFLRSTIRLIGPVGAIEGDQTNNAVDTIRWKLKNSLSINGSDDSTYSILISPVDIAGNFIPEPQVVKFKYNMSANDVTNPIVEAGSLIPPDNAVITEGIIESVSAAISDSQSGINLAGSKIVLIKPDGQQVPGRRQDIPGSRIRGIISHRLLVPLAPGGTDDGTYTIEVQPLDNAGNSPPASRFKFTYETVKDTEKPLIEKITLNLPEAQKELLNVADKASINKQPQTIIVRIADPQPSRGIDESKTTLSLEGPTKINSAIVARASSLEAGRLITTYGFKLDEPLPADGVYTVKVQVVDASANQAEPKAASFTFDTTPPTAKLSSEMGKAVSKFPERVSAIIEDRLSGIDFDKSKIQVIAPDGSFVSGVQSSDSQTTIILEKYQLPIITGVYKIRLILVDKTGNQGEATDFQVLLDTTPPLVKSFIPEGKIQIKGGLERIGVVLEDKGSGVDLEKSKIQILGPGISKDDKQIKDEAKSAIFWDFAQPLGNDGTDDGLYLISVTTVDNVGNSKEFSDEAAFIVDSTPPEVVSVNPPDKSFVAAIAGKLSRVSVKLQDKPKVDLQKLEKFKLVLAPPKAELDKSKITLKPPTGTLKAVQKHDGVDTLILNFDPLPIDGSQDGEYIISVETADNFDNKLGNPKDFKFTYDTLAPKVTLTDPANGSVITALNLFKVSAVIDDGKGSGVDINQTLVELVAPNNQKLSGKISFDSKENRINFNLEKPLSSLTGDKGAYSLTVKPLDKAGNSGAEVKISFTYDPALIAASPVSNLKLQPIAISPNGDGANDTMRLTFSLLKAERISVEIYDALGNLVKSLQKAQQLEAGEKSLVWDGTFDNPANVKVPDGNYTLRINVVGSTGASDTREFVNISVDTQSPSIGFSTISANPFTPDGDKFADTTTLSFEISGSNKDDNVAVKIFDKSGFEVKILEISPPFSADGRYSATWDGSGAKEEGDYTYVILARDQAGNSQRRSGVVTLDRNAPQILIETPVEKRLVVSKTPIVFSGVAQDATSVQNVEIFIEGFLSDWTSANFAPDAASPDRKRGKWKFEFVPKTDGKYSVNLRASDALGHLASIVEPIVVIFDTSAPKHTQTALSAPAEGSIVAKNGDTLKLKSLWDSSGYEVVADFSQADSAPNAKEVKAKDNSDGSYGVEYKVSDSNNRADGSKVIRLTATDSAGNKSTVDTITLILDNTPPKVSKALVERAKYKNGDVVKIDLTADAPKYKVSASFKEVDSNYAPGLEKVEDQGGGNYKVEYRISAGNTIKDGTFVVLISASDGANTSLEKQELTIDNTPPEFKSISRLDSPTGVYSNTQSIKLTVELEASGQALVADFSDVDSEYSKGRELITDNGDATYNLEYRISAKNTKGDAPRLRIRLTASDDVGNAATKDFFVGLDSTAPGLKIDSPKDGDKLSSPKVVIKGKVDESKAKLTINAQEVKYDQESGQFSHEISLNFGENEVKIEAVDLAGNLKLVSLKVHFSPEVSVQQGGEIILPETKDDGIANNETRINVPAAALPKEVGDGSIFIESLESFNVPSDRLALATYSFRFKDESEKEIKDLVFKKPVTLTLQFPALKEIDKKATLKVFRWDGVRWREVGGKVDFEKRTITVSVDRLSEYAIFSVPRAAEKLPFDIVAPLLTPNGDGINDAVTFKIPHDGKTTIRIYDKRGLLVKKLENGLATWDGKDEFGDIVEVGIYIYQLKTETEVRSGTIAVAR